MAADEDADADANADADAVVEPDDEVEVVDAPVTLLEAAAVSKALPSLAIAAASAFASTVALT